MKLQYQGFEHGKKAKLLKAERARKYRLNLEEAAQQFDTGIENNGGLITPEIDKQVPVSMPLTKQEMEKKKVSVILG